MSDPLGLKIPRIVGSVSGSGSGSAMSPSLSSLMSLCSESFANLKISAAKLAKEHESGNIDLGLANELKSLPDYICKMLEKFPETFDESAEFRLLHKKDETELWKLVESEFSHIKSLCDKLTETFERVAGEIQNADYYNNVCFLNDLDDVNDALKNILRRVSLEMTPEDRLKMSTVIVVKTHDAFVMHRERISSNSLMVMLFHLRSYDSYNKALVKFIELSDQHHYEHDEDEDEDKAEFIVVRSRDSAGAFKVTEYPTVVVMKGEEEVGRVSIADTCFLQAFFKALELILEREDGDGDSSDVSDGGGSFFDYKGGQRPKNTAKGN